MTAADLIAFENRIRAHWEAGDLPCLLHLCGGNEEQLIDLFREIHPGDWILSTHRNHYHALLAGIPAEQLKASILRGDSMFTFSRAHNFYSSAILAGTCCIAAGVAWDIRQQHLRETPPPPPAHTGPEPERREPRVWCFLGDGATENGHFAEAVAFVAGHNLPCTFIIEDNDRQVDTPKRDRRGHYYDDWQRNIIWPPCVRHYRYTPTYPHAGSGCSFKITFKPDAVACLRANAAA